MSKRKEFRKKEILKIITIVAAMLAINYMAQSWFFRLDLTAEKRYTLSNNTKSLASSLSEPVFIKLYLHGDLNSGFRRLSMGATEMLDEIKIYAEQNIQYKTIDPASGSLSEKKALAKQLSAQGMAPIPVIEKKEDGTETRTMVYPYAVFNYNNKTITVNLLENIPGVSGTENLNRSIEGLEYKFTEAIRKLSTNEKPKIAFLEGHGELDELDVVDITETLSEFYQVERGRLGNDPNILSPFKAIIIANPKQSFSEKDKYILDNYFMNGGRILWLVDAVNITLDSLRKTPQTMGLRNEINLDDLLFKYGIRINPTIIQDIQAALIPINAAPAGQAPKFVPAPWLYHPLLQPSQSNSITKNLNSVRGEFVSFIDTVGENMSITRTPLLVTSRYTKVVQAPTFVSLTEIHHKPQQKDFSKSFLPVAIAQEGQFPSAFSNRPSPTGVKAVTTPKTSKHTRMVVVADGDIIRNKVRFKNTNPQIIPLGIDEMTERIFDNKQFLVNTINYLCDDEGWMALKGRNYSLKLLDKATIAEEATFWKLLNIFLPLIITILGGILFVWYRKKAFTQ